MLNIVGINQGPFVGVMSFRYSCLLIPASNVAGYELVQDSDGQYLRIDLKAPNKSYEVKDRRDIEEFMRMFNTGWQPR